MRTLSRHCLPRCFFGSCSGAAPRRVGAPLNRLKRPELITQAPDMLDKMKMQTGLSGWNAICLRVKLRVKESEDD